jgi:hypothetical protein
MSLYIIAVERLFGENPHGIKAIEPDNWIEQLQGSG